MKNWKNEEERQKAFLTEAPKGVPIRVWPAIWPGWVKCFPPTQHITASATIVLDNEGNVISFKSDIGIVAAIENISYYPFPQ